MTREEARKLTERLADAVARYAKSQHGQARTDYQAQADAYNAQNEIIAALAPAPAADDVALVDELRLCAYAYGNGGGDKDREDMEAARTALLGRLAATSRDAVIEECARVARSYEPKCDTCPSGVENAIRALKGK